MYQKYYHDIAINSQRHCREIEKYVISRAISDLQKGLEVGPDSVETVKACALIQNIWSIFLAEAINDDNHLPNDLRANLISIGVWIQRELKDLSEGKSMNFKGLIEINQIIADGLA